MVRKEKSSSVHVPRKRCAVKKVSVLGLSHAGLGAALLLKKLGMDVFVSESSREPRNASWLETLKQNGISWELGGNSLSVLDAEKIVKSPGVPPEHFLLKEAKKRKIPVVGEIDLALSFLNPKKHIIGITGTNGKTTTSHLLLHILKKAGKKVTLTGHRNTALSEIVYAQEPWEFLIQELSYADLRDNRTIAPHDALLLNVHPDHCDQFASFSEYVETKFKIFSQQTRSSRAFLSSELSTRYSFSGSTQKIIWEPREIFNICPAIPRYFEGLEENLSAVWSIVQHLGIPKEVFLESIFSFRGVPHRRQIVDSKRGLLIVNDAKATNPVALEKSLEWMPGKTVLIAGGKDKKVSFEDLKNIFQSKIQCLLAIGSTGKILLEHAKDWGISHEDCTQLSFEEVVQKALTLSRDQDVLVYAPGASSETFRTSEECGEVFCQITTAWGKDSKCFPG